MTAKQKQYSGYIASGGKLSIKEWERSGNYDLDGNCLSAKDLQIGNYVFLVYDKSTPRKVEAIYDNTVFLEGRDEPDDERDLLPIPVTNEILSAIGLKKEDCDLKMNAVFTLPYIHQLQQLINLVSQCRSYASH
jgi:hypothetical protein